MQEYLRNVACSAYYAYMPKDNEYECECDDSEIVADVLSRHKKQLTAFFQNRGRARVAGLALKLRYPSPAIFLT